jgi:hypothetical protein
MIVLGKVNRTDGGDFPIRKKRERERERELVEYNN